MSEPTARPGRRADAQRDRILSAALKCFVEHGFHAASMSNIADTAGMSAGLMYRYFENKNAIVLAIVERQLEEKRALIRQMHSVDDLAEGLVDAFQGWRTFQPPAMSVALFLEMSAEATRNPQVSAALAASDAATRAEFQAFLMRPRADGGAGLDAGRAETRALLLRWMIDGLVLRMAREPDLDPALLKATLGDVFRSMLA